VSDAFFGYDGAAAAQPVAPPRTLLADLSSDEWERFIAFAARRRYAPGTTIVEAGSREPALFIVAAGRVGVQAPDGGSAVRGEGEMFGVLSFLDGAPSDVTAVVAGSAPAELLMLSPDALQRLAAWKPRIALALLRDLGGHVAARLRRLQPGD
jgi:CRP-like cAMP-binding protein